MVQYGATETGPALVGGAVIAGATTAGAELGDICLGARYKELPEKEKNRPTKITMPRTIITPLFIFLKRKLHI